MLSGGLFLLFERSFRFQNLTDQLLVQAFLPPSPRALLDIAHLHLGLAPPGYVVPPSHNNDFPDDKDLRILSPERASFMPFTTPTFEMARTIRSFRNLILL